MLSPRGARRCSVPRAVNAKAQGALCVTAPWCKDLNRIAGWVKLRWSACRIDYGAAVPDRTVAFVCHQAATFACIQRSTSAWLKANRLSVSRIGAGNLPAATSLSSVADSPRCEELCHLMPSHVFRDGSLDTRIVALKNKHGWK
jgi:hypothetical protein